MKMENKRAGGILYLVVPCYNEEEVLVHAAEVMRDKLGRMASQGIISPKSKIVFVNDGSSDNTWKLSVIYAAVTMFIRGCVFQGIMDIRALSWRV